MLSVEESRMLDRLVLAGRTASAAPAPGLRQARSRGFGLEFQDYRHYQPGDDPRSIDWTVAARLQQLVIRVSRAEGHLRLHLLVDVSGSMSVGAPSKLACATKPAAALCYLAVARRDPVGVATFSDTILTHVPPAAGRRQVFRVFDVLGTATAGGRSHLNGSLTDYSGLVRDGGLAVVISDFFAPEGAIEGLQYLRYKGLTPAVVQLVAPEELRPDISDEVDLVDIEAPEGGSLTVDAAAVDGYRQRLERTSSELGDFCRANGAPWLRLDASAGFEAILRSCLNGGLLLGYA
jgi:uncharacterized protein (DUF58 family)